jgi:hypothetical protein
LSLGFEKPTHVRVPETTDDADQSRSLPNMRGMWVAFLISESVVFTVVSHPVKNRALNRVRTRDSERVTERAVGFESAMSEKTVEADSDTESTNKIHARENNKVSNMEKRTPGENGASDSREERKENSSDIGSALSAGHGPRILSESVIVHGSGEGRGENGCAPALTLTMSNEASTVVTVEAPEDESLRATDINKLLATPAPSLYLPREGGGSGCGWRTERGTLRMMRFLPPSRM